MSFLRKGSPSPSRLGTTYLPHTPILPNQMVLIVSVFVSPVCLSQVIVSFKRMGTFVCVFIMVSPVPYIHIVDTY